MTEATEKIQSSPMDKRMTLLCIEVLKTQIRAMDSSNRDHITKDEIEQTIQQLEEKV